MAVRLRNKDRIEKSLERESRRNFEIICDFQLCRAGQIQLNRCKYLANNFPTDNADVTILNVHGWLMAMTETEKIHLLDPHTLKTVHSISLSQSKNMLEGTVVKMAVP